MARSSRTPKASNTDANKTCVSGRGGMMPRIAPCPHFGEYQNVGTGLRLAAAEL